jgi:chromosome segregation ATPase
LTDERTLAFLHELERADEAVAAVLGELDDLARATEDVRMRALELEAFRVRLPAERARIDAELTAAEREAAEAKDALARAENDLSAAEQARDGERIAATRRGVVRARDTLRMAVRRATEAREQRQRLNRDADEAEREAVALEERAGGIAAALRERPQLAEHAGGAPSPGLAGVSDWASRARAALFVVRASLAREREAVIRQANELGALVLGEPLTSLSAALVARRVEQARDR